MCSEPEEWKINCTGSPVNVLKYEVRLSWFGLLGPASR